MAYDPTDIMSQLGYGIPQLGTLDQQTPSGYLTPGVLQGSGFPIAAGPPEESLSAILGLEKPAPGQILEAPVMGIKRTAGQSGAMQVGASAATPAGLGGGIDTGMGALPADLPLWQRMAFALASPNMQQAISKRFELQRKTAAAQNSNQLEAGVDTALAKGGQRGIDAALETVQQFTQGKRFYPEMREVVKAQNDKIQKRRYAMALEDDYFNQLEATVTRDGALLDSAKPNLKADYLRLRQERLNEKEGKYSQRGIAFDSLPVEAIEARFSALNGREMRYNPATNQMETADIPRGTYHPSPEENIAPGGSVEGQHYPSQSQTPGQPDQPGQTPQTTAQRQPFQTKQRYIMKPQDISDPEARQYVSNAMGYNRFQEALLYEKATRENDVDAMMKYQEQGAEMAVLMEKYRGDNDTWRSRYNDLQSIRVSKEMFFRATPEERQVMMTMADRWGATVEGYKRMQEKANLDKAGKIQTLQDVINPLKRSIQSLESTKDQPGWNRFWNLVSRYTGDLEIPGTQERFSTFLGPNFRAWADKQLEAAGHPPITNEQYRTLVTLEQVHQAMAKEWAQGTSEAAYITGLLNPSTFTSNALAARVARELLASLEARLEQVLDPTYGIGPYPTPPTYQGTTPPGKDRPTKPDAPRKREVLPPSSTPGRGSSLNAPLDKNQQAAMQANRQAPPTKAIGPGTSSGKQLPPDYYKQKARIVKERVRQQNQMQFSTAP